MYRYREREIINIVAFFVQLWLFSFCGMMIEKCERKKKREVEMKLERGERVCVCFCPFWELRKMFCVKV
jgi:hypothetical protein